MKKTLVSALTTALVVGAASTTFAASNPFADVPAGHWAYDAINQLIDDNILEGYGDNTFRGERNITRYEAAQMIAKAMAKKPAAGEDKALIDKLAAEFADELNNLGVRVSELERNADKVKWTGEARYRYWSYRDKQADGSTDKTNRDQLQLRLFPTAEINEHWKVKARFTATNNMRTDAAGNATMTFAYADGVYGNCEVKVGKLPIFTTNDNGLVLEDFFSGVNVTAGKDLKVVLEAGRWDLDNRANSYVARPASGDVADYEGIQLNYEKGKIAGGVGFRHFATDTFKTAAYSKSAKDSKANIWSLGGTYTFDKNWALQGAYAENSEADFYKKSGNVEVDYKGANKANAGSWGAFLGYRHIGANVSLMPTFDTTRAASNVKGWDLGTSYIPMKNVLTTLGYFHGKQIDQHNDKTQTLYARVSYFF